MSFVEKLNNAVEGENDTDDEDKIPETPFTVSFFDFPLINNTRLSNDQRYSIILKEFGESSAEITLVYFPGTYACLKEKPFYEDIIPAIPDAR